MPVTTLPRLPGPLNLVARRLPLGPLSVALTRLARRLSARHPGIIARLGPHAERRFLLDLADMPFVLLLEPSAPLHVSAHRRERAPVHDTRIAGPVAAFLGMLHGSLDGDALFFSRDVVIEGDTAAALALRNALDDAEVDLAAEAAEMAGPLAPLLRAAVPLAERMTGLALHRMDTIAGGVQ